MEENSELINLLNEYPKNKDEVPGWFDSIAKSLLLNHILKVNEFELEFTEIEFYYFKKDIHEDTKTDEHSRNVGEWRFHNYGLDITFQSNDEQYGGILIRGLRNDKEHLVEGRYINGPRKVITNFMSLWGTCDKVNAISLQNKKLEEKKIFKTFRHFPMETNKEFDKCDYRYIVELVKEHRFKDKEKIIRKFLCEKEINEKEAEIALGYKISCNQ